MVGIAAVALVMWMRTCVYVPIQVHLGGRVSECVQVFMGVPGPLLSALIGSGRSLNLGCRSHGCRFTLGSLFKISAGGKIIVECKTKEVAFWINVYHCLLQHGILLLGPPKSRREVARFFDKPRHREKKCTDAGQDGHT